MVARKAVAKRNMEFVPSECFTMDSLCISSYLEPEMALDLSKTTRKTTRNVQCKKAPKRLNVTLNSQPSIQSMLTQVTQERDFADVLADALSSQDPDDVSFSGGNRHTTDAPLANFRFHATNPAACGMGRASSAEPVTSAASLEPELEYLRDLASRQNAEIVRHEKKVAELSETCKKQKLKIKKLTSDIDSLRKAQSGTRKMLSRRSKATNTVTQEKDLTQSADLRNKQEALDIANAKLASVKSEVQVATSNLFAVLADDSPDPLCDNTRPPPRNPTPAPSSAPAPTPHPSQSTKSSQKNKRTRTKPVDISVNFTQSGRSDINIENTHRRDTLPDNLPPAGGFPPGRPLAADTARPAPTSPGVSFPQPPTYADYIKSNPKPTKIVFGSSLAQGSAEALKHKGINVWEYFFSSAEMPFIHLHINKILAANPQVTQVVLLFGGNDCENMHHMDEIRHQYDLIILSIKRIIPECCIIMSSIPQRRRTSIEGHLKIATLNKHLWARHNPSENLHFVDAAPRFAYQFRDRVHMNFIGMRDWAEAIAMRINFISNFQARAVNLAQ